MERVKHLLNNSVRLLKLKSYNVPRKKNKKKNLALKPKFK